MKSMNKLPKLPDVDEPPPPRRTMPADRALLWHGLGFLTIMIVLMLVATSAVSIVAYVVSPIVWHLPPFRSYHPLALATHWYIPPHYATPLRTG